MLELTPRGLEFATAMKSILEEIEADIAERIGRRQLDRLKAATIAIAQLYPAVAIEWSPACGSEGGMLEPLDGLPEHVIGLSNHGEIQAKDYTDTLLPAVRAVVARGEELRVHLVFDEWGGMSSGALSEDLKLGVEHLTRWKKIALVTDVDWMVDVTRLFGWMTPGELKHFPMGQRDEALAWVGA